MKRTNKKTVVLSGESFQEWCKLEIQRILEVWDQHSETEALQQFEILEQLCIQHKQWRPLVEVYDECGIQCYYAGDYTRASEKFEKSEKLALKHQFTELIPVIYFSLGSCCRELELYDEAAIYANKGILIARQLNDNKAMMGGVVFIADLYNRNRLHEDCLALLDKNKPLLSESKLTPNIKDLNVLILRLISNKALGQYTAALDYLKQAELMLEELEGKLKEVHYKKSYIIIHSEYLTTYMLLDDLSDAERHFRAITDWLEHNSNMFKRRCYYARITLGKYFYLKKEYAKVVEYLEENLKSDLKVFTEYDTYPYLIKCYTILGRTDKLIQLADRQESFLKQYINNVRSSESYKYEYLRERHETKIELEHQKKILETVNEMNESLQRFANIASHDLREPLRTIGSFAQLAERALQKKEYDKLESYLGFVKQGANSGQKLVSNLYTYAKQGFESLVVEEVDCKKLIELIVLQLNNQISRQEGKVELGKLPVIRSVRSGLLLVFQNLISNALKFIPSDRQPLVKIDCNKEGEVYRFTVSDNGIGIPKDKCADIFQAFTRLNARQEYDGTGLGLATCKRVVDNLNGEISVDSKVGIGTTFTISLTEMA